MRAILLAWMFIAVTAAAISAQGLDACEIGDKRQFMWETQALENACNRDARVVNGRLHRQTAGWDQQRDAYFILDASTDSDDEHWTLVRYFFDVATLRRVVVTIHEPALKLREQGKWPWADVMFEFSRSTVDRESLPIKSSQREDRVSPPELTAKTNVIRLDMCSVEGARNLSSAFEALCPNATFQEVTEVVAPPSAEGAAVGEGGTKAP